LGYPHAWQRVTVSVCAVVPRARLEVWIGEAAASSLVTTRPAVPGRRRSGWEDCLNSAPPPLAANVSLGCRCPAAAAPSPPEAVWALGTGTRCLDYSGGWHAPTPVPLGPTRPCRCSLAADAQPSRRWHRCRRRRVMGLCTPERAHCLAPARAPLRVLHRRLVCSRRRVAAVPGDDGGHGIDGRVLDPALRPVRARRLPGAAGRSPPGAACSQPPQDRRPRLPRVPAATSPRPAAGGLPARGAEPCVACVSAASRHLNRGRWATSAADREGAGADARHAAGSGQRPRGGDRHEHPAGHRAGRA
jgi:hypothetical protein